MMARFVAAGAAAVVACVQTGSASPTVPIISPTLAATASFAAPTALHEAVVVSPLPICVSLSFSTHVFVSINCQAICSLHHIPKRSQVRVRFVCFTDDDSNFMLYIFVLLCNLPFRDFVRDPSL
jgi:hypothetical protein